MSTRLPNASDVVIVGAGNAALCAALAAAESGVSVLVLERAPEAEAGGNSRFTAGAFRCVYDGVEDLAALMPDLTDLGRKRRIRARARARSRGGGGRQQPLHRRRLPLRL